MAAAQGPRKTGIFNVSPVLKSMLVPGSGEFSLGNQKRGRLFFTSELVLLTGAIGTATLASYERTASRAYAVEKAGVALDGKDSQFWVDIGNYDSRDDYNDEHLYWRDYYSLYSSDPADNWEWKKTSQREHYDEMRVNSERLWVASGFIIGGLVVNHLISMIDTRYLVRMAAVDKMTYQPVVEQNTGWIGHKLSFYF